MITSSEAKTAIWVTSALAAAILLFRLAITWRLRGVPAGCRLLVVSSLVVVFARVANDYYLLEYGTVSDALNGQHYFDMADRRRMKTGSILALTARLLDTTFFWLQTALLLVFYTLVTQHIRWVSKLIRLTWLVLALSYVAVVLTTVLECRPLSRYWQLTPAPGRCVKAYRQLFLQGGCNIVLDLMLLLIAGPLLRVRHRTLPQTLRIGSLIAIGSFCLIVTGVKLAYIYGEHSSQPSRSLWASVQIVVSTFVANTPTIYGTCRRLHQQRAEQLVRRGSRPEVWYGYERVDPGRGRPAADEEASLSKLAAPASLAELSPTKSRSRVVQTEHREWISDRSPGRPSTAERSLPRRNTSHPSSAGAPPQVDASRAQLTRASGFRCWSRHRHPAPGSHGGHWDDCSGMDDLMG